MHLRMKEKINSILLPKQNPVLLTYKEISAAFCQTQTLNLLLTVSITMQLSKRHELFNCDADYRSNVDVSGSFRNQDLCQIALLQHLKTNSGLVRLYLQTQKRRDYKRAQQSRSAAEREYTAPNLSYEVTLADFVPLFLLPASDRPRLHGG